jgi:hypothetical protein
MALPAFAQARPDADQGWTVLAGGVDLAGGGPGGISVRGIGVDSQANVYVAGAANGRLQKLSPQGAPVAKLPSFADKATSAQSYGLTGVAVDRQTMSTPSKMFSAAASRSFQPRVNAWLNGVVLPLRVMGRPALGATNTR